MSRELVYHILGRPSSNSPQDASLESLELNNLLTWSTTDPRLPQAHHLRDVSAFVRDFDSRGTNFRMIPETRFMTELLDPLVGYFTALRSLRITTHGEFENSGRNVEQTPHQALYASWARFLASVRDTLEHFSFEQGIDHRDKYESEQPRLCTTGRHLQPRTVDRPMDVLFLEWLLPVLLEGPWPCMRHMEIRGVGRCSKSIGYRQLPLPDPLLSPEPLGRDVEYRICGDTPDSRGMYRVAQTRIAFTAAAKEKLRKILGDRVTLVIDESQSTDYECPKWDAHGIPSLPELPYEE